jgi:hypothetical protein
MMPSITVALSAICHTHFGETNEVASMARKPASAKRSISSILPSVGTTAFFVLQPVARADFDDLDLGRHHGRKRLPSAPERKIPAWRPGRFPDNSLCHSNQPRLRRPVATSTLPVPRRRWRNSPHRTSQHHIDLSSRHRPPWHRTPCRIDPTRTAPLRTPRFHAGP